MSAYTVISSASIVRVAGEQASDLKAELLDITGRPGPRRVNRFIQLAMLGARQCVGARSLPRDTAVYLTSASGVVADTIALLQSSVLGQPLAPFKFINVSGNMVGYYLAAEFGLVGSNQVLASRQLPWFSVLQMATLAPHQPSAILIGAIEACVWPLDEHRRRLGVPDGAVIGESSHWLLLEPVDIAGHPNVQEHRRLPNDASVQQYFAAIEQRPIIYANDAAAAAVLDEFQPHLVPQGISDRVANGFDDAQGFLHCIQKGETRSNLENAYFVARAENGQWGVIRGQMTGVQVD